MIQASILSWNHSVSFLKKFCQSTLNITILPLLWDRYTFSIYFSLTCTISTKIATQWMKTYFTISSSLEVKSSLLFKNRNLLKLIKRKTNTNEVSHFNLNNCNCVLDPKSTRKNSVDNVLALIKKVNITNCRLKTFRNPMRIVRRRFSHLHKKMRKLLHKTNQ